MKLQTPPVFRRENRKQERSSSWAADDTTCPSICESEVSSINNDFGLDEDRLAGFEPRRSLQWVFSGLTVWVEYEEHEGDLSKATDGASHFYGTELIPVPHSTAIYGMKHLTEDEAVEKLQDVAKAFPNGWPSIMERPVSVKADIAQVGKPGQVADISWCELTLKTNEKHEAAIDKLYQIFEVPTQRSGEWTPHISLAYDNPEDTVLNLAETISYVAQNPSLMEPRRVKAVSLWSTEGKMAAWKCLDRISFF